MNKINYCCFVSTSDFWNQLKIDINTAKERIWIQCMSFEGDKVGQELTEQLINSPAKSKRFLIDSYSKIVHNDRILISPLAWFNFNLIKERFKTRNCIQKMKSNQINIKFTNPLGFLGIKYPMRNHKKMVIVDDAIYIGGRNFCDHNFIWHDMMVKISFANLTDFLVQDFLATWSGTNLSFNFTSGLIKGWSLNGIYSQTEYTHILNQIALAKNSIEVFSPYISGPFFRQLCQIAKQNNITLKLYIPKNNNKPIFTGYLNYYQRFFSLKLCYVEGKMSHTKAIIVDDQAIFFGSTNFDVVSYYLEQELLFEFNDQTIIQDIKSKLLNQLNWNESTTPTTSIIRQYVSYYLLQFVEKILFFYAKLFS